MVPLAPDLEACHLVDSLLCSEEPLSWGVIGAGGPELYGSGSKSASEGGTAVGLVEWLVHAASLAVGSERHPFPPRSRGVNSMSKVTLGMAHSDYAGYPSGSELIHGGGDRCGDRLIHGARAQRMALSGPMPLA